jgi:hypothetical protein
MDDLFRSTNADAVAIVSPRKFRRPSRRASCVLWKDELHRHDQQRVTVEVARVFQRLTVDAAVMHRAA